MTARRMLSRLFYLTVEDEGMLAEAFSNLNSDIFAITYKVDGTEDVFVTTAETKDALDRQDIPYNLLAEEDTVAEDASTQETILPGMSFELTPVVDASRPSLPSWANRPSNQEQSEPRSRSPIQLSGAVRRPPLALAAFFCAGVPRTSRAERRRSRTLTSVWGSITSRVTCSASFSR